MDQPAPAPAPAKKDPLADGTYIRTFAKDVAKLTGKPIQEGKPVVPKKDLSPPKVQKTLEQELTPDMEKVQMPVFSAPKTEPPKNTWSVDTARGDILSRLKSGIHIEVKSPPRKEKPLPSPLPVVETPPPKAPALKNDFLSPLHTFKTDFADKAHREHASKIAVLAAEGDAKKIESKPMRRALNVNMVVIAVGAVLIIGGGGGIFFAIKFATTAPVVPSDTSAPSLIFADSSKALSGTGAELMQALADAATEALPDKSVLLTYITESTTTPAGGTSNLPLPGGALFAALNLSAPDILLRNIDESSTVGIVRAGSETRPFFILKVTSFDRTFAGMLAWEPTMARDLKTLYPAYQASPFVTAATSTASSTAATSTTPKGLTIVIPPIMTPEGFVDEIVANHDVRILYDAQHRSILLYGYRDKTTLIIARDRAAFAALLDRLSSTKSN